MSGRIRNVGVIIVTMALFVAENGITNAIQAAAPSYGVFGPAMLKSCGASHAFFDWKPDDRTKATFAQYGVDYSQAMTAFFASVFAPEPVGRQSPDASFEAILDEVEAAQVKLVNGQAEPFKALWSHSDDVTLSGGLGGAIARGWPQVSERLDWVATQYAEGTRTHQVVSRYVGNDLAYVVLRETIRFKRPTDRREMVQDLRVTQIFRRDGGQWRIVHRHADAETTRQTTG